MTFWEYIASGWVDPFIAAVTAFATLVLAFLTWVLAKATRQMASASSSAHVIASIEVSPWSVVHMDLVVTNAGNAPAYDIRVSFNPEIPPADFRKNLKMPFQNLSLLRPGQSMVSAIAEYSAVKGKVFSVSVSWKPYPRSKHRDALSYDLDMRSLANVSFLGARTPEIQIAEQIKKLREDWRHVAGGARRLKADTYSATDRNAEREAVEKQIEETNAQRPKGRE